MDFETEKTEEKGNYRQNKILALYPFNQKFPVVYDSTINFFSKNYNLHYSPPKRAYFYWLKDNHFIRNIYYLVMKILRKYLKSSNPANNPKINVEKTLLFCFNQLPPPEYDFIIDFETILGASSDYHYSGLDIKYVSERFNSEKCKEINCWNKAAYKDLVRIIDCSKFKNKISITPFAGNPPRKKEISKEGLNFLFVASVNNPVAFRTKGGFLALDIYSQLAKKYKNIKFFVRANIDDETVKKYEEIPGLIFLRKYLSDEQMNKLFLQSDVLLEPLPGMDLMMKSMEFGLPLVCFDYECAYETVFNKKTGFLIKSSKIFGTKKNLEKYYENLDENYKSVYTKEKYSGFIPQFIKKCEILIKNKKLLKKMVKNQQSLVEKDGKYSLEKRNKKLLKLINPHMK